MRAPSWRAAPALTLGLTLCVAASGGVWAGTEELIEAYQRAHYPGGNAPALHSAEVPVVGCPIDGQTGLTKAPRTPQTTRALLPPGMGPALAYYTTSAQATEGVLAPRGWSCRGSDGSYGASLFVFPADAAEDPRSEAFHGPLVRRSFANGETSGRFAVARVAARVFPQARTFAAGVRDEEHDNPGTYIFQPWPSDRIERLSRAVISYTTPAGAEGLGRDGHSPFGREAVRCVVVLHDEAAGPPHLLTLDVQLGDSGDPRIDAILVAFLSELHEPAAPIPDTTFPTDAGRASALEIVRRFYAALGRADGEAAAHLVVPERRGSGPYAPEAITRFYAGLPERLTLVSARLMPDPDLVQVRYRYRKPGGAFCDGAAAVSMVSRAQGPLIARIRPFNGC